MAFSKRTFTSTPEPRYVLRAHEADNAGEVTPESLAEKIEGSIGVVADLNEQRTKVDVHLDLTGSAPGNVLKVNSAGDDVEWGEGGGGGGLTPGTEAGQVKIWNGTQWINQDGYAYREQAIQDITWDGDTEGISDVVDLTEMIGFPIYKVANIDLALLDVQSLYNGGTLKIMVEGEEEAIPLDEESFGDMAPEFGIPEDKIYVGQEGFVWLVKDDQTVEIEGETYNFVHGVYFGKSEEETMYPTKLSTPADVTAMDRDLLGLTSTDEAVLASGITAAKVATYDGYATSKQDKLPDSAGQLDKVLMHITTGESWEMVVNAIGNARGNITLGTGLQMSNNQLSVTSLGTNMYRHLITLAQTDYLDNYQVTCEVMTSSPTAFANYAAFSSYLDTTDATIPASVQERGGGSPSANISDIGMIRYIRYEDKCKYTYLNVTGGTATYASIDLSTYAYFNDEVTQL